MDANTKKRIKNLFGRVQNFSDGFPVGLARHLGGSGIIKPIVQEKPWGAEIWLIYTKHYAFKILIVEKGKRFSLQKHKRKTESWYVAKGEPLIILGNKKITAKPGQLYHISANILLRVEARKSSAEIWEVSSPELSDVLRVNDDYGRK